MDAVDEKIITILRHSGRASFSAIGRDVGLSTNAVSARVRRLETSGVIAGFTVLLADSQFDESVGIEAFIDVRLDQSRDSEEFMSWVKAVAGVIDAVHVTGPYDYLLRVRLHDMPSLERLLRLLKREGGAAQTQTRMALR